LRKRKDKAIDCDIIMMYATVILRFSKLTTSVQSTLGSSAPFRVPHCLSQPAPSLGLTAHAALFASGPLPVYTPGQPPRTVAPAPPQAALYTRRRRIWNRGTHRYPTRGPGRQGHLLYPQERDECGGWRAVTVAHPGVPYFSFFEGYGPAPLPDISGFPYVLSSSQSSFSCP
jgi:hypothetical protein